MASSMTTVRDVTFLSVADDRPALEKITLTWTAHTDGTFADAVIAGGLVKGTLQRMVTNPDSPAPAALYDITITDEDGFDILNGAGANRSATVTEEAEIKMTTFQRVVANTLTVKIANIVTASATGAIVLYVLR